MWIYQHKNWPNFTWHADVLTTKLAEVRYQQGMLLGRMASLGFEQKQAANLGTLTNDVIKSSAIEGEALNHDEVRSSIACRLGIKIAGLTTPSRDVEGIVEMMLDATQKYSKPLTKQRLFDWHAALFPTGRSGMHHITVANWRTEERGPMQVISGPIGRETVHFEAPPASNLEREMQQFLTWFNSKQEVDPILRAAIAHFWFVTIHPFEDGNGRIARAIGDMALAEAEHCSERYYSFSTQIESERKNYYKQLEKQQRNSLDITDWLIWFVACLGRAILYSETLLSRVLSKAKLWAFINQQTINSRQRKIINRLLEEDFQGYMNTSKYAKIAKCSNDTALRDIQSLLKSGIFIKNQSGGRSTSYRLVECVKLNNNRI